MHDLGTLPANFAARVRDRMALQAPSVPEWLRQQRALRDLGISLVRGELEDGRTIRSFSGTGFLVLGTRFA